MNNAEYFCAFPLKQCGYWGSTNTVITNYQLAGELMLATGQAGENAPATKRLFTRRYLHVSRRYNRYCAYGFSFPYCGPQARS